MVHNNYGRFVKFWVDKNAKNVVSTNIFCCSFVLTFARKKEKFPI